MGAVQGETHGDEVTGSKFDAGSGGGRLRADVRTSRWRCRTAARTSQAPVVCATPKQRRGYHGRAMATATATTQDPSLSPIAIVESFLRALERLDLDAAERFLSDDVVYQNVPLPAHRGKDAVIRALRSFTKFGDRFEARIRNIAERDGVVLTERIDVLGTKDAAIELWVCGTFEIRGGKIVLWRDYFDVLTFVAKSLLVWPRLALYFARQQRSAA